MPRPFPEPYSPASCVPATAYRRLVWLCAMAKWIWTILFGSPLVSGCQVLPPSVDLKRPPSVVWYSLLSSHGPCRTDHIEAYATSGFDGSNSTGSPPVFSFLERPFVQFCPPSLER